MSPGMRVDRMMMWLMGRGDEASCREAARHLQEYLDGQTDPGQGSRIGRHLETCRRCGLEADVYTKIKDSLGRQGQPVDPGAVARLSAFGATLLAGGVAPDPPPRS